MKMAVVPQVVMALSPLTTALSLTPPNANTNTKTPPPFIPDYTTSEAGNPFTAGWYADPDCAFYNDTNLYWVYPTTSAPYDDQTYLDAFSSPDLVRWTKHHRIIATADIPWAVRALWAPAPIFRAGKYYLYFAANDIQESDDPATFLGGIGVAVSVTDRPEGPYIDAVGAPLIGEYHNGAQPIDQAVFVDDDGKAYIYYGGHGHLNVARLNDDMVSIGPLDGSSPGDGQIQEKYMEITPRGYVEGPLLFRRRGVYYLMWSQGGWGGPDYAVSYAMSSSGTPLGPFDKGTRKILEQDAAVATGSGHNGVINVPGTDIWYIVYHRRPLGETDQNHRVLAYDRLYFDDGDGGSILPVRMLVRDNFEDGEMFGWGVYGGGGWVFGVEGGRLVGEAKGGGDGEGGGGMALLDTNFGDLVFEADVAVSSSRIIEEEGEGYGGDSDAGLVFRVTGDPMVGGMYNGYYAGISTNGTVILGKADAGGGWTQLGSAPLRGSAGDGAGGDDDDPEKRDHHMRVRAVGSSISVFVDDMNAPKIVATDDTWVSGKDGVRVSAPGAMASFDNVSVSRP